MAKHLQARFDPTIDLKRVKGNKRNCLLLNQCTGKDRIKAEKNMRPIIAECMSKNRILRKERRQIGGFNAL
ncbi:MAG: hypothetical protein EBW60_06630 [Rhodobacteraceae bacterium]|nr:hypothetical protein [Paracoccaceae bacterium]